VAKGVGQLLDKNSENLFNISKKGKGIKHWLNDVSLIKSQKEIAAQGGNVKKNLMKLNIAQISGITHSAVMLGILLPKLNICMTKHDKGFNFFNKKDKSVNKFHSSNADFKSGLYVYDRFSKIYISTAKVIKSISDCFMSFGGKMKSVNIRYFNDFIPIKKQTV